MKHLFDRLEQSQIQLIQALAEAEEFNLKHLRDRFGRFAEKVGKENPIAEAVNRQKQVKEQERNIKVAKKVGAGIAAVVGTALAVKKVKRVQRVAASKKAGVAALDRIKNIPDLQSHLAELGVSWEGIVDRIEQLHDIRGIPDKHHKSRLVDADRFTNNIDEMISGYLNSKELFDIKIKPKGRAFDPVLDKPTFADLLSQQLKDAGALPNQKTVDRVHAAAAKSAKSHKLARDNNPMDLAGPAAILINDASLEHEQGFLWRKSAVVAEVKHGGKADKLVRAAGKKQRTAAHEAFLAGLKKNDTENHSVHVVKPEEFFQAIEDRFGAADVQGVINARYFGADPRSDALKAAVGKRIVNPLAKFGTSIYDPAAAEASLRKQTEDLLRLNQMAAKPIDADHKIIAMRTPYAGGFNLTIEGEDTLIEAGLDPKVLIHEYGHSLENKNPEMQSKIQAFRSARSARTNKTPTIGDIPDALGPVLGYLDEFLQKYSGRAYPDVRARSMTEVSSTAIENLFNTRALQQHLSQDREHMMTVLGALAGD